MNKVKCENGHFFDVDRFPTCPICGGAPAAGGGAPQGGGAVGGFGPTEMFPDSEIGKTEILGDEVGRTEILTDDLMTPPTEMVRDPEPYAPQQPQAGGWEQPQVGAQGQSGMGFQGHATEMARYEGFDEGPKVQIDELAPTEMAPTEEEQGQPAQVGGWEQPQAGVQPQSGMGFQGHATEMARYEGFDEGPKVQIDELAPTEMAPTEEETAQVQDQGGEAQAQPAQPRWDEAQGVWVQDGQTLWDEGRNAWVQTPAFIWDAEHEQWLQGPSYIWNEAQNAWLPLPEEETVQAPVQQQVQQETVQQPVQQETVQQPVQVPAQQEAVQPVPSTAEVAQGAAQEGGLAAAVQATGSTAVSAAEGAAQEQPAQEQPAQQAAPAPAVQADDGLPKTMAYYDFDDAEPPVAWLVGVKGPYRGKTMECTTGKNRIGRNQDMDINLADDTSVTRALHATVLYDPAGRKFYLQPGDSDGLTYRNGALVMTPVELAAYDKITLGKAEFVFLPLCGEQFTWDTYMEE